MTGGSIVVLTVIASESEAIQSYRKKNWIASSLCSSQ
jgi:hypothetical protein